MPCNLAVSITKAVVTQEYLRRLLTPEVLTTVLEAFLAAAYDSYRFSIRSTPIGVTCTLGEVTFAIVQGTISVRAGARTPLAERLLPELELLVRRTSDTLLLQRIHDALGMIGSITYQTVLIDDGGVASQARVLTTHVYDGDGAVDVRIVVLLGGRLQIFVDGDVSFETARSATLQVVARLQVQGIPAVVMGAIEQHKDGVSHAHMLHILEERYDYP